MTRLPALGIAIMMHSVFGISYYFISGKCSPAPLLGTWLFTACIAIALQAIRIFPQWCLNKGSLLFELATETVLCCAFMDLLLTKFWCPIESLCQCAINGILHAGCITEEKTFDALEYWLLGIVTTVIGSGMLWLVIWATKLPHKIRNHWKDFTTTLRIGLICSLFGPIEIEKMFAVRSSEAVIENQN